MKPIKKKTAMRGTASTLALLTMGVLIGWGQAPVPHPDEQGVYPTFGGVKMAKLTHAVSGVGPSDSRLEGLRHVCALLVVIGADGTPGAIEIENKLKSPFDDSAVAAVRHSQFEAGSFGGKPVPTRLMVWVPFFGSAYLAVPVAGPVSKVKGLTAPMMLNSVEARFTDEARLAHRQGVVLIQLLVTEEGTPRDARVLVPLGKGLDENALKAVENVRFKPAMLEGVPVPVMISFEVNFRLPPF